MKVALIRVYFYTELYKFVRKYHVSTDEETFDGKYLFASSVSSLHIELVHK